MNKTKEQKYRDMLSACYVKLIEGHTDKEIEKACDCIKDKFKCKLCVARDIINLFYN